MEENKRREFMTEEWENSVMSKIKKGTEINCIRSSVLIEELFILKKTSFLLRQFFIRRENQIVMLIFNNKISKNPVFKN